MHVTAVRRGSWSRPTTHASPTRCVRTGSTPASREAIIRRARTGSPRRPSRSASRRRDRRQRPGRRAAHRARAGSADGCAPRVPSRGGDRHRMPSDRMTRPRRSIRTWSRLCSIVTASRFTSAAHRFPGRATRTPHPGRARHPTRPADPSPLRSLCLPRRLPAPLPDADAGADRAFRGARAAARALARRADRRRSDRRHPGARRRHPRGPRARAHALSRRARVTRI